MDAQHFNGIASSWMQMFFIVFAHAILLFALITSFVMIIRTVFAAEGFERLARVFALLTAPLIVLGARAFDISIPDILLRALSLSNPFVTTTVGVIIPGGVGALAAWFFVRVLKRGNREIGTRIMIMVGALIMFEFGDVYVAALREAGTTVDRYLAPNIAFTLALFFYIALNYKEGVEAVREAQYGLVGD